MSQVKKDAAFQILRFQANNFLGRKVKSITRRSYLENYFAKTIFINNLKKQNKTKQRPV